jgi:hypothetical protein
MAAIQLYNFVVISFVFIFGSNHLELAVQSACIMKMEVRQEALNGCGLDMNGYKSTKNVGARGQKNAGRKRMGTVETTKSELSRLHNL